MSELNRSNAELAQFAYVASHDLQEPLRMVSSYTQLLPGAIRGDWTPTPTNSSLSPWTANRMQTLINDLLAYSRVGTRGKEFEPTDCKAAFDLALANLKAAIEESGAVVTHGPLPTVMADKMQFGQLFQNLIGNAVKYHGAEPPQVMSRQSKREMTGSLPCAITASASIPSMPTASSSSSSACTPEKSTPARASAWPSARRSWSVTAGGSGWSRNPAAAHFLLHHPAGEVRSMSEAAFGKPVEILLVEDNPGDGA